MGLRLTKTVRQQLLEENEGFTTSTFYEGSNFREQRDYSIEDGELHIRARGNTSWSDSHFDNEWVASDEEAHGFLYRHLAKLQLPNI